MYYKKSIGALAQLVARNVRNVEVTGSNPVCSTTKDADIDTMSASFRLIKSARK